MSRKKPPCLDLAAFEPGQWVRVCRPFGIGDAIMATAACRALQRRGLRVEFQCYEQSASLLTGAACIDRLVTEDVPNRPSDLFLKYPFWEGFPRKPLDRHVAVYYLEQAGCGSDPHEYELPVSEAARERACKLIGRKDTSYVTVHPYPGFSVNRAWPLERWSALINRLSREVEVLVLGGPGDPPLDAGRSLNGRTSLPEAAALVADARLNLTIDSWTQHAAWALGTPTVVLFGPTNPTGFGYPEHRNLWAAPECAPCYREMQDVCADLVCMRELTVEAVWAVVKEELEL
jgi:ADP-heptose:LPS heptosyltransferase